MVVVEDVVSVVVGSAHVECGLSLHEHAPEVAVEEVVAQRGLGLVLQADAETIVGGVGGDLVTDDLVVTEQCVDM